MTEDGPMKSYYVGLDVHSRECVFVVELVGYARRNFMVPIPQVTSFAELNARLLEGCRRWWRDRLRGHAETIGERLTRDREAFLSLPQAPYEACEKRATRVNSLSLV